MKPVLAIVSNRRLEHVRSGSAAYLVTCLQAAAKAGYEVRLIFAPVTAFGNRPWAGVAPEIAALASPEWPRSVRAGKVFWSLSPIAWGRFILRLAVEALHRLKLGKSIPVKSLLSTVPPRHEMKSLRSAVARHDAAAVVVEYSSLAPLFSMLAAVPVRAVLMHDLFSSRAASFKAAGKPLDHADMTLEQEAERLSGANLILHASMNELARMQPLLPNARHVWMRPTTRVRREAMRDRAPAAAFVGADHAGNREALEHLCTEIWPRVLRQAPEARLLIAGAVGAAAPRPLLPGMEIMGPLDDLAALAGPDIVGLAPIRVASGVAIKVADYMGLGMPVIGYPGGLDGFGDELDSAALRVENPETFASELAALLSSAEARRARSEAGLHLAQTLLSDSGIVGALAKP